MGGFGGYLAAIDRTPLLTAGEEREVAVRARAGDAAAADHLARANLRLVVRLARRHRRAGECLEELVARGNVGLLRAVRRFDPGRGLRFSTYAAWWVRQAMGRGGRARVVEPSRHVGELVWVWRRAEAELGGWGGPGDVAALLGMPAELAGRVAEASGRREVGVSAAAGVAAPAGAGPGEGDEPPPPPPAAAAVVAGLLRGLEPRERRVLELRYGLTDRGELTPGEVGEALGVSAERARQLEVRALARLREAGGVDLGRGPSSRG